VLRDDGTLWLNLGDSYAGNNSSNGEGENRSTPNGRRGHVDNVAMSQRRVTGAVANLANVLERQLKGGVLFYGRTDPRGRSAQRVHVLIQDKTSPDVVLQPLFTAERVRIKDGQDDLCEIGGGLDAPIACWASRSLGFGGPGATAERVADQLNDARIILTTTDLDPNAPFGIPPTFAVEDGETPFTVKVSSEPVAEGIASGVPAWDAVTFNASPERFTEVNPVDDPVSLFDGAELSTSLGSDFRVRKATSKQVTFDLHRGAELCVQRVGHLSLLRDGILPYRYLLDQATKRRNESQTKQELGIPEMVKRALMQDGWICRQTIIWSKPNPMPESVTDRCTKSHEYLFLLTKSARYYYDAAAIAEPLQPGTISHAEKYELRLRKGVDASRNDGADLGYLSPASGNRNKRSVWTVATQPYAEAHFATFPGKLIEPCILAGTREGDTVLDCFGGSGTTGEVATRLGRNAILIELNPAYRPLIERRTAQQGMVLV
jgi:hypothetical protein